MATIEQLILQMKVEGKQSVDSLNDSVKRVGSSINDLKSDIAGMAQVGGPLSTTLNGIIGRLGPLGIAASLAGAAFVGLGAKALQMAGDLSDISGATGIAAGTLKNFKDSVIEAGGSADDFAQLAAKLNQSVQEAAGGNEQFQKAFRELGVYVTDTSGRVRSTESILRDLTERFQQGELTSKQYSSAIDILGRNINKLELQKLKALANPELDADIKRLDRYNEQIDKLRSLLEKQIITFFGKVAEDINKGIDAIDKYYDKLEEKEKELNARGKTSRAFTPDDLMSQAPGTGIPYRLGGRAMTDAEKAILKRKEFEAEMERLNRPYQPRPNEREDTGGGFGAEPESIKKAREEAQKYV
jgi:methyl-accepting chemotaxis protein